MAGWGANADVQLVADDGSVKGTRKRLTSECFRIACRVAPCLDETGFPTFLLPAISLAPFLVGVISMILRKAGGNWVVGDRFFDSESEIEALVERVEDGIARHGREAGANVYLTHDEELEAA